MTVRLRKEGGPWHQAERVPFPNEAELQAMLHHSPELIPLRAGENAPRVFVRESGLPGSGSTDLLGVDSDGNIYIVECKLASNSEIRRKVLGQVIEYAAFLWNMPYEEFDQLFVRRENETLLELMSKKVGEDWEAEEFRAEVSKNLRTGSFHLLIAVDRMNNELSQIIRYLAACAPGVRVEAVEINIYKQGETEVLVPEIHGREVAREALLSPKKTLAQVLETCPTETGRLRLSGLVEKWIALGHSIEPGSKGISFRAQIEGDYRPVFWAPNPNFVSVDFNWLLEEGLSEDAVKSFREKIAAIKGFDPQKVLTQTAPRALVKDLDEPSMKQLAELNHEIVSIWRTQKSVGA